MKLTKTEINNVALFAGIEYSDIESIKKTKDYYIVSLIDEDDIVIPIKDVRSIFNTAVAERELNTELSILEQELQTREN